MNILGVGPAELLLIFVIALIVLGPGKLPDVARTLGKAIREFRRMSLEVTAEFAKEFQDVGAISKEMQKTTEAIKQAADIEKTLGESVESALTAGESKEEPRSPESQETTNQVKAEEKGASGDKETSEGERD